MVKSQFILDILILLLDGEDSKFLITQLDYISDSNYNYTNGGGCFITFSHSDDIIKYKLKGNLVLNGVTIESPELKGGADVTLFMKDGIIDYLEIWSFDGKYPNTELKIYKLSQVWQSSAKKIIER